jgi:hypothetical protein
LRSRKFDDIEKEINDWWKQNGFVKKNQYESLEPMIASKLAFLIGAFDHEVGLTHTKSTAID